MASQNDNMQTAFLEALVSERKTVWIFLVNGIKLTGQVITCDRFTLLLESQTGIQAIFKSSVSTVCEPHSPGPKGSSERPSTARAQRRVHSGVQRGI
ncbi:RNA chaperone Hfq [Caballeronia sp. BCC1704]|uniref:RNA chaperone Hfq n=1 Tax=Caballeronia sp. BCC1704 TaxID=2676300 RepID=UPI00158869C3|nr:RNA chaperone Hfq [Caballeronia sp. BCC1704]